MNHSVPPKNPDRLRRAAGQGLAAMLSATIFLLPAAECRADLGDQWTWRNPVSVLGTGSTGLLASVPTSSGYVAVGRRGLILVNGTLRNSGVLEPLFDVAADGPEMVAVGPKNTILSSLDSGVTWAQRVSPGVASTSFLKVVRCLGKWFALSPTLMAVSSDGVSWSTSASLAAVLPPPYFSFASNGTTLLVGGNETARSLDGGSTWTTSPGYSSYEKLWNGSRWLSYSYVGDQFYHSTDGVSGTPIPSVSGTSSVFSAGGLSVAAGNNLYTSPDGLDWTDRGTTGRSMTEAPPYWVDMANAGQTYVLIGGDGDAMVSSDGGTTWSRRPTGAAQLNTIVHNGTAFIAGGPDGSFLTSTDGLTWQNLAPGSRCRFRGLAWHGGLWVAVGKTEAVPVGEKIKQFSLYTSPDGITWTDRSFDGDVPGIPYTIYSVTRVGNQWVAAASGYVLISADGISWTYRRGGIKNRAAASNGTRLVLAGGTESENNSGFVHSSTDGGTTWTNEFLGSSYLRGLVWSGARFIAVGDRGHIFTSPTAAPSSWTHQQLPTGQDLRGIAYDPAAGFVIVGGNLSTGPVIFTSSDGTNWIPRFISGVQLLYSVIRAGNLWVATGYDGLVVTSPDGATWTRKQAPTTHELYAGAWNGTEFLTIGEGGTILATDPAIARIEWISFLRQPSGSYRMEWEASRGTSYRVESSPDLNAPWTEVSGSPVNATGPTATLTFTPPAPAPPRLFFRVRK
jgi:photosystem II stability/assembly factor-like uncharacterized protein